jgi:hypothetical protein
MKTIFTIIAICLTCIGAFFQYKYIQIPLMNILGVSLPHYKKIIPFIPVFLTIITTIGIGSGVSTLLFGQKSQTTFFVSLLKYILESFIFIFVYKNIFIFYFNFPNCNLIQVSILFLSFNIIVFVISIIAFIFKQVD